MNINGAIISFGSKDIIILHYGELGLMEHDNPYHKEGNLITHINMVVSEVKKHNPSNELLLAALFHDIGKPMVREYDEEKGWHTYHSHEKYSEQMFREIYEMYHLGEQGEYIDFEAVCFLIRNHHKIDNFEIYRKRPRRKKSIEILTHPFLQDLVTLRNCDGLGRIPQRTEMLIL